MNCTNCNKLLTKLRRISGAVSLLEFNQLDKGITIDQKVLDCLKIIIDNTNTEDLKDD